MVVGNKIRWADLSSVKSKWESNGVPAWNASAYDNSGSEDPDLAAAYRTLITPVYYQIRQLAVSPSGTFLAICTEHTVHIAVLPDSSRLRDRDQSPLKLKVYQLGPTTHVIPESPVMSVLWHPLAVRTTSADCLVTVTAEAAVRVWEIDRSSQWSFEKPALAIDLRRLADGVSCDEDFEPSGFGKSRGFSVDAFDMEVSAACFGGQGYDTDQPWASMTLWTAMRNGDLYALCPLLPSKWLPTSSMVASLSISAIAKLAIIPESDTVSEERKIVEQQYEWIKEIDASEPSPEDWDDASGRQTRARPQIPCAIPKLQGPFEVPLSDSTVDVDVSDVYVFPAKLDRDEVYSGEDEDDQFTQSDTEGLPYAVICLATTDGQVYVSLDLDGVSGQWLPKRNGSIFPVGESQSQQLLPLGTLQTSTDDEPASYVDWPMLTANGESPLNLYLTTLNKISSISLSDWCSMLAMELVSADESLSGLKTRLETLCRDKLAPVEQLLSIAGEDSIAPEMRLSAPLVFDEPDIGLLLLTSTSSQGYAVCFDTSDEIEDLALTLDVPASILQPAVPDQLDEPSAPPRPVYQIPDVFERPSMSLEGIIHGASSRTKHALKQPIRLSPAVLEAMTSAHRYVAPQCSRLEKAAAELFRRCERLQEEIKEHVKQMAQLSDRLHQLKPDSATESSDKKTAQDEPNAVRDIPVHDAVEKRITSAQERQKRILQRLEEARRKAARAGNRDRPLSTKEVAWMGEISALAKTFGVNDTEADSSETEAVGPAVMRERVQQVRNAPKVSAVHHTDHVYLVAKPRQGIARGLSKASTKREP